MKSEIPLKLYVFKETKRSLSKWMVGDTKKAFDAEAYVGAAILGFCAVDALGGLYAKKPDNKPVKCTRKTFKKYIEDYMNDKYRPIAGRMYGDLRCMLAHGYSTRYFILTDHQPENHLKECLAGGKQKMGFNVDTFIEDLKKAVEQYRGDLLNDNDICRRYLIQVRGRGILRTIPDKDVEWL